MWNELGTELLFAEHIMHDSLNIIPYQALDKIDKILTQLMVDSQCSTHKILILISDACGGISWIMYELIAIFKKCIPLKNFAMN